MWITDVPTQQIDPPAIYLAANTVSGKAGRAVSVHKLGVCQVINGETSVSPVSDAGMYLYKFKHKELFEYKPDGSLHADAGIRIIKQPKYGRLMQEHAEAANYEKFHYKYIPNIDNNVYDHFVVEAKADGIAVQIYYTTSYVGLGQPTYVFDDNNRKVDNLERCPKSYWKISLPDTPLNVSII